MITIPDTLDLDNDENIAIVRQSILAPMIAKQDYASAIEVLQAILNAQPDRIRERSEIASYYARLGRQTEAESEIQTALSYGPENPAICAQAIQISLQFKNNKQAAEMALGYLPDCLSDPRLSDLSTTALYRDGQLERAAEAARISVALNRDALSVVTRAAGVLTRAGCASEAALALSDADVLLSEDAAAFFEYGNAKFQLNKQDPAALEILQAAFDMAPENGRAADLLLRALLANGKNRAAVEVVEKSGITFSKSSSFKLQFARALRSVRRYDEAADIMVELSNADPDNSILRRQCASALAMAGRQQEALGAYQHDLDVRAEGLPETLVEGLEKISARLEDANIPTARFEWAYQRLKDLGVEPVDRDAWEKRVRWINLADYLILDWLECNPEQGDQVMALIDGVEAGAKKIRDNITADKGAFLVTGHIGALFAGPAAFVASGLDGVWVASTPVIDSGPAAGRILSTSSTDEMGLARAIMSAVKGGRIVTIAIDGAGVPNLPRRTLFNRQVGLSDYVPRTCYRTGIKSFFSISLWDADRIKTDVIALPTPNAGETRDAFVDRWFDAYINEIKAVFINHADNLRMSGGFWSGIST